MPGITLTTSSINGNERKLKISDDFGRKLYLPEKKKTKPRGFFRKCLAAQSFTPTSDRNAKERFRPVNARAILSHLASLPIETWNFKQDDSGTQHIGPMSQDFYAAFRVGPDDKHIATVDADGVAFAAIQGLNEIVQEQNAELAAKGQKN